MISQEILQQIKTKSNERIEDILAFFNIEVKMGYSSSLDIRCCCPIHGGNNPTAFSYDTETGYWRCFTKGCHEGKESIFGLVELLLKNQDKTKNYTFIDSVKWLASFLNISLDNIEYEKIEKSDIDDILKSHKKSKKFAKTIHDNDYHHTFTPVKLEKCLEHITYDKYFLKLGFTNETIKKFHIGYCSDRDKPMYKRSFALVLDISGETVIGVTGRTHLECCSMCGTYHVQGYGCPDDNPKTVRIPKWKHYGFLTSTNLYNLWNAKDLIQKTNTVVITEGPKDTWWLDQCGIHNAVSIYGLSMSPYQINELMKLGTTKVVLALDNDERGQSGTKKLIEKLSLYFKTIDVSYLLNDGDDIADSSSETIQEVIKPIIGNM